MPIEIHAEDSIVEIEPSDLVDSRGIPTMEADAIAGFLRTVDFTPLFDNPQIQQFVEMQEDVLELEGALVEHTGREGDEIYTVARHGSKMANKGGMSHAIYTGGIYRARRRQRDGQLTWRREGSYGGTRAGGPSGTFVRELQAHAEAQGKKFAPHKKRPRHGDIVQPDAADDARQQVDPRFTESESISGETAVQFIDERDLLAMFKLHLREEFPRGTLSERTILSLFSDLMEGSDNSQDARRMAMIQEVVKRARFRKRRYAGLPSNNKGVTQWRESEQVDEMLIPGHKLNDGQKREVLAAFVHRHTTDHPYPKAYGNPETAPAPTHSDEEWLKKYAFHFSKKSGKLSRAHKRAEPHFDHYSAFNDSPNSSRKESHEIIIDFPGFETVNEAWPTGRNYKTRKNVKKRVGLRSTVSANAWRESEEGVTESGSIQHSKFHDGGFVLHKVKVGGNHYSAWFSADGKLKDAEPGHGARVRHVGSNVRTELSRVGQRYVGRQESTQSQTHVEGASLASQLCESMAKK